MLKIRLSRVGKQKAPFYRIVLTEHSKPVKSGYKEVLGWHDPLQDTTKVDIDLVKEWIGKGAKPSNRTAKILFKHTEDKFFKEYIVHSDRVRKPKNAPDEPEETTAPAASPTPEDTPKTDKKDEEVDTEEKVEENTKETPDKKDEENVTDTSEESEDTSEKAKDE